MKKIATRVPWRQKVSKSHEDLDYEVYNRIPDLVGAFMVMVETVQDGNKKWAIGDIIKDWWLVAFESKIVALSPPHNIVQISSRLLLNGYKKYKLIPNRDFIKLNNEIQSEKFFTYKRKKVESIAKDLTVFTTLELNN